MTYNRFKTLIQSAQKWKPRTLLVTKGDRIWARRVSWNGDLVEVYHNGEEIDYFFTHNEESMVSAYRKVMEIKLHIIVKNC